MDFAARVERIEPSATVAISNRASELEADGIDVVDLSVGDIVDFDTPENVKDAARAALDAGHTGYTQSSGIPELKSAIVDKFHDDGLTQYETGNVIVTPGGKQGLFEVFQAFVEEGDEVALIDPAWVSYEAMAKIVGADLTRVDTTQYDFALEPALDDLAEAVSDETDLLVVNSPGNPHGMVYADAALEGVRDLAVEHDITVISDEIYKKITYDGVEATSLGAFEGMADRTVTLNGFSKAYAMTGWRLGYYAGPEELVSQASKIHGHSVTCAVNFVQHAGVEALENTDEAIEEMRSTFESRRDMLVDLFAEHGTDVTPPEGAFYIMLPVADDGEAHSASSQSIDDQPQDVAWAEEAIDRAHVATVPGSAFGAPGYVRLAYANDEDRLREGVERLAENDLL
jgi:aspartate aminotransferase